MKTGLYQKKYFSCFFLDLFEKSEKPFSDN